MLFMKDQIQNDRGGELFICSFFQAMNLNNVWFVLNKFYRDMNSN